MKTAIVIPGFMEHVRDGRGHRRYEPLLHDLNDAGYVVITINITWAYRTIDYWVPEAEKQLEGVDTKDALLIGFSYGAMIASILATRHEFGRVFLCSLSPYFAEDVPKLRASWFALAGKRRIEVFKKVRFADIVKNYKARETIVFAGTFEMARRKAPLLKERGLAAAAKLPNARFIAAEGAGHNLADPGYAAAIKAQL